MEQNMKSMLEQIAKKNQQDSLLETFTNVAVAYLGVEPKSHFAKLKDAEGNNIKDENNRDKRSEISDGYTCSFNEIGSGRSVKIVLNVQKAELDELELLNVYLVSGKGYNIKGMSPLLFIEQNASIQKFEMSDNNV